MLLDSNGEQFKKLHFDEIVFNMEQFINRMLTAFKVNVQILERRLEEEQKFTGSAVREMDARLNLHNRRIERLEQIQRKAIDEEPAKAAQERATAATAEGNEPTC